MEYTVGGIGWARIGAGIGYSPYKLNANNIETFADRELQRLGSEDVLIFRERDAGLRIGGHTFRPTSPWQEEANIGFYHERVIAVTNDGTVISSHYEYGVVTGETDIETYFRSARARRAEFAFVGVKRNQDLDVFAAAFRESNLRRLPTRANVESRNFAGRTRFDYFRNNCQDHAQAVRGEFGFR